MFGYLRFFLSFLVVISHVGIRFYGLNPGVIAVVIFYLLAGHVVSRLWSDILPCGPGKLAKFYTDRALRIFPLYIYVSLLTLVFLVVTGYAKPEFSFLKLAGNFLVVPLNYYMVVDTTILTKPDWCLVPPAWSLGAELQAYVLLPLVLMKKQLKLLLAAASFGVYLLANLCVIHPDYFGYRLIFGVFFVFVAGASLQAGRAAQSRFRFDFDTLYPWLLWFLTAVLCAVFSRQNLFSPAYTRETFIGILVGIPLVRLMGKLRVKLPWNGLLGSLSYGVFLSHFLMIWLLDHTGLTKEYPAAYIPVIIIGSTLVAYSGVKYLEDHIDKFRK
ncbi:acyltransferase family protein [Desulfobacula phenolica]|uniref:Peptidoglycan/LPS O-acetylase OafA/YrhL, contains acyltransferase and SGNH-hydrolase domains n=1 Tax=Desulfobacula phenolica TaxID=90732 RepID=A0A1H2DP80_9BACT|nr:acyltransferase [Desulfobacula phenolica]SDT84685.1 Peptidoglycan/LPS O-acetylase OafA/YrhL, contains acyltransferase and SGNH-hydrolase domains [Desulfobacula phenolica]